MNLNEAKAILESAGYIIEDTLPNADSILRKKTKLYHKHLDLDHKYTDAANFNIKNLFDGIEKKLKKIYKKVEIEASDYDDENKSQLVKYYYTFNKKLYNLKVLYRDEDDVINVQLFSDNWYGYEKDDFSVTTIDDVIKKIIKFTHYNTI